MKNMELKKEVMMEKYCIAIMGSPQCPEHEWTDERLEELKNLGFNTMQLNIAWGGRPNDEALNLEDILLFPEQNEERKQKNQKRQEAICGRLQMCQKHGFRTIFHFGAPYNGQEAYAGKPLKNCIGNTNVVSYYYNLLEQLNMQIPGIDDILIYTYDQDAWLCSEFQGCDSCRGVPLHKRLPNFLTKMCEKWAAINANGRLWWEPWELSAGQVLRMVQELPVDHFGLMVHSNIGEVQKARPADLWFRNLAMLAKKRKIPVVAELFLSEFSEETEPLKRIPCPRLTYDQVKTVLGVSGVVGIKEYYGLCPGTKDPCLAMVGQVLNHPEDSVSTCLERLAEPYGKNAAQMVEFWENVADAYMLYPWDVSWFAREIGKADINHGWSAAFLRGQQCSTPSWESSRHSIFMKTDDRQPHPWMLEDIQLRCELAAKCLETAMETGCAILEDLEKEQRIQMEESVADIDMFRRVCVSYALHLRETNVAMLLRKEKFKGNQLSEHLEEEMGQLLLLDAKNQNEEGRIMTILKAWQEDPEGWLDLYLLPSEEMRLEKGYFSLTSR